MTALGSTSPTGTRTGVLAIPPKSRVTWRGVNAGLAPAHGAPKVFEYLSNQQVCAQASCARGRLPIPSSWQKDGRGKLPMLYLTLPKPTGVLRLSIAPFVLFRIVSGSIGATELDESIRRVLIFYEVGTSHSGVNLINQGILAGLDASRHRLEVYREYMDAVLFPDPADQQRFRKSYVRKYQNRRPDLIIAVGPSRCWRNHKNDRPAGFAGHDGSWRHQRHRQRWDARRV